MAKSSEEGTTFTPQARGGVSPVAPRQTRRRTSTIRLIPALDPTKPPRVNGMIG